MLGIVVSRADEASVHVGERLLELADWSAHRDDAAPDGAGGGTYYATHGAELREFDGLHVELDRPAEPFDGPDLLAFASRHSGETGPLLTAHHTGNVGPAEFGGEPNELAVAAPGALSAALEAFERHAPDGYDVGLECTHHGPTDVAVPSLFVEVGSDEPQWRDPEAAAAAARAILDLRGVEPTVERTLVGFGGGHYAPRFARIVRETDWAVGHVVADWSLAAAGGLDRAVVRRLFERSGAELAVVDGERPDLVGLVESLGYRVVGETWVRETDGVPLALVERAEATLGRVDDGLRFGDAARGQRTPAAFQVVEPPAALLADASGVDADGAVSAVAAGAVAFETAESGSRPAGRVAVPDASAWDAIEARLVDLLADRFDDVTVEPDEIVAVERAFDPDRARALGVEAGPAFGRLAAGDAVEVDGREVTPEEVHVTRRRRYPR